MSQINIAQVDLNLLKTFEALHDESSASRAALRLGVTQSAISAGLRRLREVYGDQLFVRTGRGLARRTRAMMRKWRWQRGMMCCWSMAMKRCAR